MKTQKLMFGIITIMIIAVFVNSLVLAEDNLISANNAMRATEVSSGKIFWKEVGLWFTFNQGKKSEKEMELAQLRLQQAEYATQNNMNKQAEKALNSYNKLMNRIEKRNELIQSKSVDSELLSILAMDQAILAHQDRIERLSNYLLNSNLTAEEKARIEEQIAKAQNVTTHLQEVQADKEERIKTKIMAKGNLTESEAEVLIDNAKENVTEIIPGAREAWKDFKNEAKARNLTPGQFAKERRQEFQEEFKKGIKN